MTKSKLENDTEIARAKRAFDVKKAEYDTEVNTAKAEADLAYNLRVSYCLSNYFTYLEVPIKRLESCKGLDSSRIQTFCRILQVIIFNLQAAVMQQKIKDEAIQVEVIDRQQQIAIAEHEIQRKHCELDSRIK